MRGLSESMSMSHVCAWSCMCLVMSVLHMYAQLCLCTRHVPVEIRRGARSPRLEVRVLGVKQGSFVKVVK